jgi:NTE family protein
VTRSSLRPRVGLALGGGGARGIAHIGVLKVLGRENVPIDFLAGTSIGGIIAAPYAAGLTALRIEEEALRLGSLNNLVKLVDWLPTRKGLLQGQAVYRYLGEILGDELDFDDLIRQLAIVTVDLNSGREVVLRSGLVSEAMRATMAIPGVFAPMRKGDAKLVDGGILNNVPADVARSMGADVVIAVDVAAARLIVDPDSGLNADQVIRSALLPNFALDMWRAQAVMMQEIVRLRSAANPPDLLIKPAVPPDVTIFTMGRMAELIRIGEEATEALLPEIMALVT